MKTNLLKRARERKEELDEMLGFIKEYGFVFIPFVIGAVILVVIAIMRAM